MSLLVMALAYRAASRALLLSVGGTTLTLGAMAALSPWVFELWRWFERCYDYIVLGTEG